MERAEFASVAAGFALFPPLSGNGNRPLVVNPGGTAVTVTPGTLALAGNFATTGVFNTTIIQVASVNMTLPSVDGTFATLAGTETFTNKTLVAPTVTGVAIVPTAAPGTNTTQPASTAYVVAGIAVETSRAIAAEALLAPLLNPALVGNVTVPTVAFGTNNNQAASTAYVETAIGAGSTIAAGLINGLTLSNDGATPNTVLDISAGRAADSTNAIIINLASAITKSVSSSWVTGTGNGGMGVGLTATASTWYHVFAIIVAAVPDVYFDTSPTAANKPVGTTAFRRIGSLFFSSSSHILPFSQYGDRFDIGAPVVVFNGSPSGTTAATLAVRAPAGVVTQAILTGSFTPSSSGDCLYLSSLAQADVAPGAAAAVTASGAFEVSWAANVATDTNSSVRMRASNAFDGITVLCNGWIDTRGR